MSASPARIASAPSAWKPQARAAALVAVLLALAVALGLVFGPSAILALARRWEENGFRRAAELARTGRLDAAQAVFESATSRPKAWIDASGAEGQRVYLGRRVWIDHRDCVGASRAFLAAGDPELAREAAWEAIWRYHAVNRAGESPEPWQALADAARAGGDADLATRAQRVTAAWSEAGTGPLWAEAPRPPAHAIPVTGAAAPSNGAVALAPDQFRVEAAGRFNPANAAVATSAALRFDRPCVVAAPLPEREGAPGELRFEARGEAVFGWPPIVVAQWRGDTRFEVIASADWREYTLRFRGADAATADDTLRLAYLNHGAAEGETPPRRRTLELRAIRFE